ncbi:MAG: epimerase [Deltaproteobacteria bacterium]|nr:epimerase [Deltaproteobacteria bacterium]
MKSQPHSGIKQITVFGGSGATGKVLIRHAWAKGLRVRTLVRNPDSLGNSVDGAEIVKGSLSNSEDIDESLKNADAVFCVFGARPPYTDIFCEEATKTIIASMKKNKVERLICQTGGMIGDYPGNRTFFFKMMISIFNKRLPLIALDRIGQEKQVVNSGLSWTIVKPPRLVDKQATGKVVAGNDVKLGLLSSITREDLAEFLINETLSERFEQSAVFVRN